MFHLQSCQFSWSCSIDLCIVSISHFYLPLLALFDLCRCMHCNWMFRLIVDCFHPFEIYICLPWAAWLNVNTKSLVSSELQVGCSTYMLQVHIYIYVYTCSSNYLQHISDFSLCILRWWAGFSDRLISATLPSPGVSMRPWDFFWVFSLIQTGSSWVPIRDGTPTSCKKGEHNSIFYRGEITPQFFFFIF